ncbi:hypothetical protein GCM10010106_18110 [Thermopolyspora flexuosa]|jgi:rubrerythrin|uniref:Rubrerythrin n=1 Tax=Thermopolyspora flexuosa TaxID=103836 RepID=A0A543J459_9ACTN|nr:ferritin family protein [Thermopolyspora flexuosa]TQM77603.1 rubrerythrin [Thermopolyspora flexuosa]GGM72201.1 hypothetical protein GCM10010106_18110 [Thermopolyspora flexuosa]
MGIRGLGRLRIGAAVIGMVALLAVPTAGATAAADPRETGLHRETKANAWKALELESFAYAANRAFAVQAHAEDLRRIRDLYDRGALIERRHFAELAALIELVKDNATNLRHAIQGAESTARMYRRFAAEAKKDGELAAARLFHDLALDEADNRDRFREALQAITKPGSGARIPADVSVKKTIIKAGPPKVRTARTLRNLRTAMEREALAFLTDVLFAEHAKATGRPTLAKLFGSVALVELTEHFAKEAILAGLVKKTRTNVCTTIKGENYESTTLYPRFARQADRAGDYVAAELFLSIADDDGRQARSLAKALAEIGGGC